MCAFCALLSIHVTVKIDKMSHSVNVSKFGNSIPAKSNGNSNLCQQRKHIRIHYSAVQCIIGLYINMSQCFTIHSNIVELLPLFICKYELPSLNFSSFAFTFTDCVSLSVALCMYIHQIVGRALPEFHISCFCTKMAKTQKLSESSQV